MIKPVSNIYFGGQHQNFAKNEKRDLNGM